MFFLQLMQFGFQIGCQIFLSSTVRTLRQTILLSASLLNCYLVQGATTQLLPTSLVLVDSESDLLAAFGTSDLDTGVWLLTYQSGGPGNSSEDGIRTPSPYRGLAKDGYVGE